jgi:hypothetical protein
VNRKQKSAEELGDVQRMRKSTIRTDLLRIFAPLPSRSYLRNRYPVDEVARGEMPYEPFEKGVLMIRDGTRVVRQFDREKQEAVREAVHAFCSTLERYMLEPLGEETADVIPLLLEETRVQGQCDQAQDLAKLNQSPNTLSEVARQAEVQARVSTRLAAACWRAAGRAGLTLIRSGNMQAAR